MAMRKSSSLHVESPFMTKASWLDLTLKAPSGGRIKTASETLSQYDPAKWLLSHATIMASVDIELADPKDPKSDYFIKPEFSQFVNNNGDCWERELLVKTYRTFIGANNYMEHVQVPELSKGKVIDAALREVVIGNDIKGNPITTLYVDLLIATSWDHPDVCQKILSGEYNAMSMGCLIAYSRCSRCGHTAADEANHCEHVRHFRKNTFYDQFGRPRIIAEICGHKDDPKSVSFIDASWVRKPAFVGAVVRNVVAPPPDVVLKSMERMKNDPLMIDVKARSIIDTDHHSVDRFAKAASLKIAEGEDGAARFEDPSAKPTDEAFPEMPEGGGDDPAQANPTGDAPDTEGVDPAAPEDPTPTTPPDVANATPFKDIEKSIEDSVITSVKQILLDKVQQAVKKEDVGEEIGDGINRYTDITRSGEALVKEASSPVTVKYLKDRYSVDISKVQDVKLAASLMAFAVTPKIASLKKFGFTRKEAAEVLRFVDSRKCGCPVPDDVYNYICNTESNGVSPQDYALGFIYKAVRPLTERDRSVLSIWPRVLEGLY